MSDSDENETQTPIVSVPQETNSPSIAMSTPGTAPAQIPTPNQGQMESLQVTIEELKYENSMLRNQVILFKNKRW